MFAHTNPIYFPRNGTKVRSCLQSAICKDTFKGPCTGLDTGARFAATAEKQEALCLAEQARRLYAGLEK
ncbi:MAG: hypothetical protein DMG10_18600 [Acidobacteria bacterium]|nr:MAG: hypothetical protein DMG10_18600 [Acidobacteriota bacterium]PYV40386.1 MAG: hypothetical protein DMG09_06875 [Acidobacteriota bacterium]